MGGEGGDTFWVLFAVEQEMAFCVSVCAQDEPGWHQILPHLFPFCHPLDATSLPQASQPLLSNSQCLLPVLSGSTALLKACFSVGDLALGC